MVEALAVAVACGRPVARVAPAPPAPIVARTGCGTYEVDPNGTVAGYRSRRTRRSYVVHPRGHLAVYRDGRLLWRSRIRHGSDEVIVHGSTIAFTVYGRTEDDFALWMAQVGRAEVKISAHEDPIGWTAGGLVTQRDNLIRVRGADGVLLRTIARGYSAQYDATNRTVVFISSAGQLVRTDGRTIWRLARVPRRAWVTILASRMLQVVAGHRALYFRSNGSLLGAAPIPFAGVAGLPRQNGVAYVLNVGRMRNGTGVNIVYLLRANSRPRRLYAHTVPRPSCGEWAALSYANGKILYADDEGPIAVIDPSGRTKPRDLTRALNELQPRNPFNSQLSADWAANWR